MAWGFYRDQQIGWCGAAWKCLGVGGPGANESVIIPVPSTSLWTISTTVVHTSFVKTSHETEPLTAFGEKLGVTWKHSSSFSLPPFSPHFLFPTLVSQELKSPKEY